MTKPPLCLQCLFLLAAFFFFFLSLAYLTLFYKCFFFVFAACLSDLALPTRLAAYVFLLPLSFFVVVVDAVFVNANASLR